MTTTDAVARHDASPAPVAAPVLTGVLEPDAEALRRFIEIGEGVLADLPPRAVRSAQQQQTAADVHRRCRRLRTEFLARHAEAVHAECTDGGTTPARAAELVVLAAERFPGLVPTTEQMASEGVLEQPAKEGREIDQGLFLGAILSSPSAGRHLIESMQRPTARAERALAGFRRTGRAELGSIVLERRGQAAYLEVRNLPCLNAEDNALIGDMETAVDLTLLDDTVRVGVIRGGVMTHPRYRGRRVFSAGINLKDLHGGRISYVDFLLGREIGYLNKIVRGLRHADGAVTAKPWIGAVDSFAIGGGTQILLVLDMVIAAADSFLSLPAADEGIIPGLANLRLTRAVGSRIARQVILGGRRIAATEPDARLLVDRVVDPDAMDDAVAEAVEALAKPAVVANRHMLNLAEEPLEVFREYLAEFAIAQAERIYEPDVMAKLAAFGSRGGTG